MKLTTPQLSEKLRRCPDTIQRWVRKGWITSTVNSTRGPNAQVFDLDQVLKEMEGRGLKKGKL